MSLVLPALYVILDAALLTSSELDVAKQLTDAGVRLLQYRNKRGSSRELLQASSALAAELVPAGAHFFFEWPPQAPPLPWEESGQPRPDHFRGRRVWHL